MCTKINMTEQETINSFLLGLPTSIRGVVAALNPENFSQAFAHACKLKGSLPTAHTSADTSAAVAALQSMATTFASPDPNLAALNSQVANLSKKLDNKDIECQICRKKGHTAPSCYTFLNATRSTQPHRPFFTPSYAPQPMFSQPTQANYPRTPFHRPTFNQPRYQSRQQAPGEPPFCVYCKKWSHTRDECRKRKAAEEFKSRLSQQTYNPSNAIYHPPYNQMGN